MRYETHVRAAKLLTEVLTDRAQPLSSYGIPLKTLNRVLGGDEDYLLTTLVGIADILGYDVVINLRSKS